MSVFTEALQLLGIAGSTARYRRPAPCAGRPRQEQRELAARMRALPGRFADRISAYTLRQVTDAAAAGRWEEAVEQLVIALHARMERITTGEHAELREVLRALDMPVEIADGLGLPHD